MTLICLLFNVLGLLLQPEDQKATGRSNAGSIAPAVVVDSTAGGKTRALLFDVDFTEPSGNKRLDSRETGRLRLLVSNVGRQTVKGVVARVSPLVGVEGVSYRDSIIVGDVPPSSTRYAVFYFLAAEDVPTQVLTFKTELYNPAGKVAEDRIFTFLTERKETSGRPRD